MKEVGLHRANRAAENPCDLIVRQVVIHAEHDGGALLPGQSGDRRSNLSGALRSHERRIGGLRAHVGVLARLQWLGRRHLDRHAIQTKVYRNAVEPGADGGLSLESMEGAIRANEDVLREIARVLMIAGEAITELVDVALVPLDEYIERGHLPRPALLDQRVVIRLGPRRVEPLIILEARVSHGPAWRAARSKTIEEEDTGSHRTPIRLDPWGAPDVTQAIDFRFSFAYSAPMLPLTKRQREILDYLNDFIQQHGYAPSLEEIGRRFGLSSLATVHKHLTNLQEKGFIKRAWNRSRSVEMVQTRAGGRAVELPLLGYVAAGAPIEAVAGAETIAVPESLVGKRDSYVLRVKGDSMIDEQIRDGDYVIVEDRRSADNGEMVIAMLHGSDVTLKKLYREHGRIRLQPANPAIQPLLVAADAVQVQGVVVGVMRKY